MSEIVYGDDLANDTINISGNGDVMYNLLGGVDTVNIARSVSDVTFTDYGGVVHLTTDEGNAIIWSPEIIIFNDGAFISLKAEEGMTAAALYEAAFDRLPDVDGMEYWMTSGKSADQMARDFIFTAEGQTAFAALSHQDFVETLYVNVLDRDGEDKGIQYWTSQLDSGALDRGDVLASFALSDENVALIGQANPYGWLENFASAA